MDDLIYVLPRVLGVAIGTWAVLFFFINIIGQQRIPATRLISFIICLLTEHDYEVTGFSDPVKYPGQFKVCNNCEKTIIIPHRRTNEKTKPRGRR